MVTTSDDSKAAPTAIISGHPQIWNTRCTLRVYLASRHDAGFRYATFSTSVAIESGFFPGNLSLFLAKYSQGDTFLLQLDGRILTVAKINRRTGATMAFHCPPGVPFPTWSGTTDKSEVVSLDAVIIGPLGYRLISKEHKIHPKPAPKATVAAVPPHLDPILETPAESAARSPYPNPPRVRPTVASDEAQFLVVGKGIKVYRLTDIG